MPSIRRRNKHRSQYTQLEYYAVASGHDFFGSFKTEDDWREAWQAMKDELLPAFIQQCPGQRPWAWWKFEATERRQPADGKPHPFDDPERQAHLDRIAASMPVEDREAYYASCNELYFGLPRCLCIKADFGRLYEDQATYLERLGLLTDAEREFIAALPADWQEREFDEKKFDAKAWARSTNAPL
ncbi:MAG: hypothetical protein SGJ19_05025 [Planctomycetia bacterium]|nr:hypothetical protein [Planctomycetia bacterium]